MVDEKIVDFIKKMLKEKISLSVIRSKLGERGWAEKEIDDAMKVAVPRENPKAGMTFCQKCEAQNPEGGEFCQKCGFPLSGVPLVVTGRKLSIDVMKRKSFDWAGYLKIGVLVGAIIGGLVGSFYPLGLYDLSSSYRIATILMFGFIGAFVVSVFLVFCALLLDILGARNEYS